MVKWPIAKIVFLRRRPEREGAADNDDFKDHELGLANWDWSKNKSETLLRYNRTPAVTCDRSILVYSQPRTRGMCAVVNYWP